MQGNELQLRVNRIYIGRATEEAPMHMSAMPITALPALVTDGAVHGLVAAEMLGLATRRLWAAPHRQPGKRHPDWRDGPKAARLEEDAAEAFDVLMRLVVATGHQSLDVRCPSCPGLGGDEVAFLAMLRAAQTHPAAADTGLVGWLPAALVRAARSFLAQFAGAMGARDLWLPARLPPGVAGQAMASAPNRSCLH
jgi:hypothetical protein